MPEPTTEQRKITELRPHPEQARLFGDQLDHKIRELAAKIKK